MCDDTVPDPAPAGVPTQSSHQEEVVPPKKDPEQTPDATEKDQGAPVKNADGTLTMVFSLQAKQSLGTRFAEMRAPEPSGRLVATSITENSALWATTGGYCGVRAGDVIVNVNGEGKSASYSKLLELLTEAKSAGGRLELTVRPRPEQFEIDLDRAKKKEGEKMGIVVAVHEAISDRVEVRQISDEGAVPSWNESHADTQVVSGDWVVAVNGEKAPANDMISSMQTCWQKKQKLTVQILTHPSASERMKLVSKA